MVVGAYGIVFVQHVNHGNRRVNVQHSRIQPSLCEGKNGIRKWYETESVDFSEFYNEPLIHEAFRKALIKHFGDKPRFSGMQATCLQPYHIHEHPIAIIV